MVYEAAFLVFPVFAGKFLIYLRIAVVALPAIFIGLIAISFQFNNFFIRTLYKLMAVWIGLVLYLFLAGVVLGFASFIFANLQTQGEILFGLAILIAAYGVIHSQIIKIVKVKISLRNLPDAWNNRLIVFVSDLHLGHVRGQRFAERVANRINELNPEIVLIGGDLYDGVKVDNAKIIKPLKKLSAPKGVYFVTGNHDGFSVKATEEDVATIAKSGIKVLQNELIKINGVQLIGVDYKQTADPKRYKEVLDRMKIDPNSTSILIKHVPDNVDIASGAGISLQISGHTHRAQMWPLRFIPRLIYKGFDYGLKRSGLMQVFISSGVGTWGPPLRVGTNSEIVLITLNKA